jgi:hypothetical protein
MLCGVVYYAKNLGLLNTVRDMATAVTGMLMLFVACSPLFLSMLSSLLLCRGMFNDVPYMLIAHGCSWHASLLFPSVFPDFPGMLTAVPCILIPVAGMFRHAHYCSWQVHCF